MHARRACEKQWYCSPRQWPEATSRWPPWRAALTAPITNRDGVLRDWVSAVTPLAEENRASGDWAHRLLLEVVSELDGHAGLGRLVRAGGARVGRVYLAWFDALRNDGDLGPATAAAIEGLGVLKQGWERAALAERLATVAANAGDDAAAFEARVEAWRSQPSVDRLLALVHAARQANTEGAALTWLADRRSSPDIPAPVRAALLVLAGSLDTALNEARRPRAAKAPPWVRERPNRVLIPALLVAGANDEMRAVRRVTTRDLAAVRRRSARAREPGL